MLDIFEYNEQLYKRQGREEGNKGIIQNYSGYCLSHGKKWKDHKYIDITPSGRYVYEEDKIKKVVDSLKKNNSASNEYAGKIKDLLKLDNSIDKTKTDGVGFIKNAYLEALAKVYGRNAKKMSAGIQDLKTNAENAKAVYEFMSEQMKNHEKELEAAKAAETKKEAQSKISDAMMKEAGKQEKENKAKNERDVKNKAYYTNQAEADKAEEERKKKGLQHSAFSMSEEEFNSYMERKKNK